ncbi:MAG: hypothetical protein QXL91_03935, partial [Candidatus Bathyarchaeia archaeon]
SYRYVWSYLQKIEKTIGEPLIEIYKGGKAGGGGAKLTRLGKSLLKEYRRVEGCVSEVLAKIEQGKRLRKGMLQKTRKS